MYTSDPSWIIRTWWIDLIVPTPTSISDLAESKLFLFSDNTDVDIPEVVVVNPDW